MALLNYIKQGSYTRIKSILYQKNLGTIDAVFEVLTEQNGEQLAPDFELKANKIDEQRKYEEEEKAKLTSPPNEKPADQTQEDYDAEVQAYTAATQQILDDAPTKNAFSLHFNEDDLYTNSNLEELAYNWFKTLPVFEGVIDG